MLQKCCSERDILLIVGGEGSEGPLFAVCSSRYSGRIESMAGDICIENNRRFVSVSSHRRRVFNPRIPRGVDFTSSVSSPPTFQHSDDQRP